MELCFCGSLQSRGLGYARGIFSSVRAEVSTSKALKLKIISKLLSNLPLGRLAFRASIAVKHVSLLCGSYSQRAIEYPWILKQLGLLKPRSIVLDVGCAESLLSHELIARKYRVVGIDTRDCPFKNKLMLFIKRNILNTGLPNNFFDSVIIVSTIEHIALKAYGQQILDDEGDMKAMEELHRISKPGGIIMITTPYVGNEPCRLSEFERNYDQERLKKLVNGFRIIKEEYFYPKHVEQNKRLIWKKIDRERIGKRPFSGAGLVCLILQKPSYARK